MGRNRIGFKDGADSDRRIGLVMEKKLFSELGLSEALLKAVEKAGYEEATPIQRQTIPELLAGNDLVGQSQTGSGKTAAFALPAIERVDPALEKPQVLILCPTRELAMQVATEVAKLASFKPGVREVPIYGGQSYDRQLRGLRDGAQIVIGTPGRILDHLDRRTLSLKHLKTVILDEADRMLDMGFCEDIEKVLQAAPEDRQSVFFSATLPSPIVRLIKSFSHDPVHVQIQSRELTVPKIEQEYYEVDRRSKLDVLCRLIDVKDMNYGIIFCATKTMVDDLTETLQARGYLADKLHGDIAQNQREKVIDRFRHKRVEFLVATDVAARGLDVDDVEVVFNYDLPHDGEDYVHRIGRTGRAGREGRAITFVAGREIYRMQNIMRFTGAKIRRMRVPTLEEVGRQKENQFFNHLRDTLEAGAYKRYDDLVDRLLEQQYSPTDIASALIDYINGGRGADAPKETAPKEGNQPKRETPSKPEKQVETADEPPPPPAPAPEPETPKRQLPAALRIGEQTLVFNLGRDHQISAEDLTQFIVETTGVGRASVSNIQIRTKRSYADVDRAAMARVIQATTGVVFKKRKVRCEAASETPQ